MKQFIIIKKIPVYGVNITQRTYCTHYHSELDVIAILFKCCQRFYACYECHRAMEEHPDECWPVSEYHMEAILCGGCGNRLSISNYLSCNNQCPQCNLKFNPGCKNHYHLYFTKPCETTI